VSALAEYLNNFEERLGPRAGGKDETELLAKEWVLKVSDTTFKLTWFRFSIFNKAVHHLLYL
jgi:hypothetical protein